MVLTAFASLAGSAEAKKKAKKKAACPGSKSVTAGGFSQSGASLAGPIGSMLPLRSQRLAKGAWVAASVYGGAGTAVTLNSHAYCA